MSVHLLGPEEWAILSEIIEERKRLKAARPYIYKGDIQSEVRMEFYAAKAPSGGIPGRDGDTCYGRRCHVQRGRVSESDETELEIVDEEDTEYVVFNRAEEDVEGDAEIKICRDLFGVWWCVWETC